VRLDLTKHNRNSQLVLIPFSDSDLVVPHSEVQRGEAVAPPQIIEQLVCDWLRVLSGTVLLLCGR
jgi:hypothetical protein